MLVPGLENAALSKMISSDSVGDVHLYTWLCKCGQEILAKYAQKQEDSERQAIKTKAVKVLLSKLGDASENPRETILSALKSHAKVLQGYEHLFSAKGNTFVLVEQTQGLRKNNDQAPVSLLRYHDLKNKLLGPDTPLTARQKKVISELAEKKSLTLKTFEALEAYPRITARIVIRLHEAGLFEPGLCTRVLVHPHTSRAVAAVVKLHQENLLNPELYTGVLEHQDPFGAAVGLVKLHEEKLLKPDLCARVLAHLHPFSAAIALVKLHQENLLKSRRAQVLGHKKPDSAARAFLKLNRAGLLKADLCARVLEHPHPSAAAVFLVKLHQGNLLESKVCARVPEHKKPDSAIMNPDLDSIRESAAVIVVHSPSETVKVELLYGLLIKKMADAIKGFCMAIQNNHPDVITAFIEKSAMIIAALPLEEEQKSELLYRLLACKDVNDVPIFYIALKNGHSEAITAFIQASVTAINALSLSEAEKVKLLYDLLASKMGGGTPGFYIVLQRGHTDATTAFIQESAVALARLIPPEAEKEGEKAELVCKLLASKKTDGRPGFHMALQHGHSEVIAAFIQASMSVIARLILPEVEKAKLLCELLASKNADGAPALFMALQNGYTEAIPAFVQESAKAIVRLILPEAEKTKLLCELLASKRNDGLPGFFMALQKGHSGAITAFIQASVAAIDGLSLSEAQKVKLLYDLLASKAVDNTAGFFMALQKGHSGAITAFIQASVAAIDGLSLSEAQKVKLLYDLLASKAVDNTPGFFMALQKGHSGAITAFIQASVAAIDGLSLSEAQKVKLLYDLLASKAVDNTPGFFMALQNGLSGAITTFIQESAAAINRVIPSDAKKAKLLCELLAGKDTDGRPGFLMTLYNGHTKAVTAFIQESAAAIAALSLSEAEKAKLLYELLASKKANGMPGFLMTLYNGHTKAVTAFIQESAAAIAALSLSEAEKARLLYDLLASKAVDNTPGFYTALQNGHADAITAFIQESAIALARLILPDTEKAKLLCELLASKRAVGTPGFYMALCDGHTETITAFIQESTAVIAGLSLPKAEKTTYLYELLVSKGANGLPGFFIAMYEGHTKAVIAFIQASVAAMAALSESEEERAELIYGLFDRIKNDNKDKFLLVLERGGPAASKVFTECIDQLPLSAEQKRNLKTLGI